MKNRSADGLRGIAALNVTVTHFLCAFVPSMLHNNYPSIFEKNQNPSTVFELLTSPFATIFYNGHFAVLIFFVLSGYVLTIPYFAPNDANRALDKRLWGRYLRLNIPIFIAVMLSYGVYASGLYMNAPAADMSGSTNWLKTFYPGGLSLADAAKEATFQSILLGKATLIPPLWTLKVEFIGSLYVLLFYIAKPRHHTAVSLALVLLLIYAIHGADSIYFYAIFLGSLCNKVKQAGKLRAVFFITGLYFGAFQFESALYNFLPRIVVGDLQVWDQKTFYNLIGAGLVTVSIIQGLGEKILQGRVAQFLGRISYAMYLLHFIVLCSLSSYLYLALPMGMPYVLANFVVYVAVCFIASWAFQKWVDVPSIHISHRFTKGMFGK